LNIRESRRLCFNIRVAHQIFTFGTLTSEFTPTHVFSPFDNKPWV
jgi:hypothetical protein